MDMQAHDQSHEPASYLPLVLVLLFIIALAALLERAAGGLDWLRAMRHFMGLFFLVFGAFKLMDWAGFANAYAGYDIVARRSRFYAYLYPLIELVLGVGFLFNLYPTLASAITVLVMAVSSVGVIQQLVRHRHIQCACLGVVVKLPMTTVTVIEDIGMGLMALAMLIIMR